MRILIYGSEGHIGSCLTWALTELGHEVHTVDINGDPKFKIDVKSHEDVEMTLRNSQPHAIVSCMPYFLNGILSAHAIEECIPYFDLGGKVAASGDIQANALICGETTVFTDLGLAPGWVNIMAEHLVAKATRPIHSVNMLCGGLPQFPEECGPLQYMRTWSLEGLLNEYADDCHVLRDGRIETIPGMSGLQDWVYPMRNGAGVPLECFYTSGGAAHTLERMQSRGIQNCSYKTVRYQGHHRLVTWMLDCGLDQEGFSKLIPLPSEEDKNKDLVIVGATLTYEDGEADPGIAKMVMGNDQFSAMQQATAFPLAAVVENHKAMRVGVLKYEDVPYEGFHSTVSFLFKKMG